MRITPPAVTRVPVEVFDSTKLAGQVCPIPSCRRPVAVHSYFEVGPRGARTCSEEARG